MGRLESSKLTLRPLVNIHRSRIRMTWYIVTQIVCMTLSSILILTVGHDSITKCVCEKRNRFKGNSKLNYYYDHEHNSELMVRINLSGLAHKLIGRIECVCGWGEGVVYIWAFGSFFQVSDY